MTEQIDKLAQELQSARRAVGETIKEAWDVAQAQITLQEEIDNALRLAGHGDLIDRKDRLMQTSMYVDENVKNAQKAEKVAAESFSQEIEKVALLDWAQGKDVYGRGLHPHAEIIRKFTIVLPENPFELGAVVTELVQKGKRDLIEIKTHGATDWFKATSFTSPLQKSEIPAVRIDSAKTWPLDSDS